MSAKSDGASIASNDPRATDEALRLLGLFFVNFSRYTSHLEHGLSRCIGVNDARVNRTMWALTSGMGEYELRKAFFTATALVREPSEEERKIRKALNARAQNLATKRNDFAHGSWHLFSSTGVETDEGVAQIASYEPVLARTSGKLNEEPGYRDIVSSRRDLEVLAQEAEGVALLVWEYLSGIFVHSTDMPGVTDRLGLVDGVLVRRDLSGWTTHQS